MYEGVADGTAVTGITFAVGAVVGLNVVGLMVGESVG